MTKLLLLLLVSAFACLAVVPELGRGAPGAVILFIQNNMSDPALINVSVRTLDGALRSIYSFEESAMWGPMRRPTAINVLALLDEARIAKDSIKELLVSYTVGGHAATVVMPFKSLIGANMFLSIGNAAEVVGHWYAGKRQPQKREASLVVSDAATQKEVSAEMLGKEWEKMMRERARRVLVERHRREEILS